MTRRELANKLEENYYLNRGSDIILTVDEDDEYSCKTIIKRCGNFFIGGTATWGEYDGWAYDDPRVFTNLEELLEYYEADFADRYGIVCDDTGKDYPFKEDEFRYGYKELDKWNTQHIYIVEE